MWAPWRKTYLRSSSSKRSGCLFCSLLRDKKDKRNLVLFRTLHHAVILNRYPYTSGHLMVIPFVHKPNLEELDSATRAEMIELTSRCTTILKNIYHPQGFNVGVNIGEAAGAGVKEHVHIHIVPRWKGDTNFMSTVGETRVLPEELESTYERVKNEFGKL